MKFILALLFLMNFAHAQSTCAVIGETPLVGNSCCTSLKPNATTGVCEDALIDVTLVSCGAHSECASGKGCFVQREDDLFSATPSTQAELDKQNALQDLIEGNDESDNDAICTSSADCESYSCVKGKCVDKKICRFAGLEENKDDEGSVDVPIPADVKCEEGLVKNAMGRCDIPENEKNSVYIGLLDKATIPGGECKFERDEDLYSKSELAIQTLRAMEWHFSTSGLENSQECLGVLPFVRDEIGKKLYDTRKKILNEFNKIMGGIEKDYDLLKSASDKSEATVTYNGESIKEKDLANRRPSGYDGLTIMWRRNLAFQSYELSMKALIDEVQLKIATLSKDMATWSHKKKKWTLNGKQLSYKDLKCRGGKKKKIKKRWNHYSRMRGGDASNNEILEREAVKNYLAVITGSAASTSAQDFKNGPKGSLLKNYYLIDVLMPGGKKGSVQVGSYKDLWNGFHANIKDYFKGMKDGPSEYFIYEPELGKIEERKCYENLDASGCEKTKLLFEKITDIGFAQFISYGVSSRKNYKKFFNSSETWRRKLFARLETDTQNISKFYEAMASKRDEQSACLEKAINAVAAQFLTGEEGVGLDGSGTSTTGSGSGAALASGSGAGELGSSFGSSNAISSNTSGSGSGSSSNSGSALSDGFVSTSLLGSGVQTLTPSSRKGYQIDLSSGTFSSLNRANNKGTVGSPITSGLSGNVGRATSSNAAAISARSNEMKAANQTAGASLKSKEDASDSALKALGSGSGSSSGSSSSNGSGSGLGSGLNASLGSSLLSDIERQKVSTIKEIQVPQKTVNGINGNAAAAGSNSGLSEGNVTNTTLNSNTSVTGKTALSDADSENVMANYERTKGEYQSSEDDELFSKVSKAYVRNLDKVLKKKKIQE